MTQAGGRSTPGGAGRAGGAGPRPDLEPEGRADGGLQERVETPGPERGSDGAHRDRVAVPGPERGSGGAPEGRDDARRRVERERAEFHREVAAKQRRRRRAREEGDRTLRSGWGAFGIVGWSIAVPTLLGVALGLWLDARFGGGSRYTLSLLALGLIIGMVNVWNWMNVQ